MKIILVIQAMIKTIYLLIKYRSIEGAKRHVEKETKTNATHAPVARLLR